MAIYWHRGWKTDTSLASKWLSTIFRNIFYYSNEMEFVWIFSTYSNQKNAEHGVSLQLPIHLISNECEWEKYKSNLRKWGRVYHKDAARISFFVKIRVISVKIEGIMRRNPQKIQIISTNLSKLVNSRTSHPYPSPLCPWTENNGPHWTEENKDIFSVLHSDFSITFSGSQ